MFLKFLAKKKNTGILQKEPSKKKNEPSKNFAFPLRKVFESLREENLCKSVLSVRKKALLFINGIPPKNLPILEDYSLIACTDGAFHYLKEKKIPLEKLDFISGDFDSHSGKDEILQQSQNDKFEVIFTIDQNKTDFEKALEIITEKGFEKVDVFGGSGGEMDHFLGNLHVAFLFKNNLEITFFDEFSQYFFIPKNFKIENVKGKIISLFPFPSAENITTKGLEWSLNNENLSLTSRIGTRNLASEETVFIDFEKGDLLVFVGI